MARSRLLQKKLILKVMRLGTWSRCNDMVHSWIVNTLNPEIADSVIYYSTAHEVWEDLCERFSQSNAPRIFEIQRDIACLRQEQLSVSAYYTKLKGLWDELASYNAAAHGAQQDQQKLMQFLMGLNESYSAIRGQILLMNPLLLSAKHTPLSLKKKSNASSLRRTQQRNLPQVLLWPCAATASLRNLEGRNRSIEHRRMEPTDRPSGSQNLGESVFSRTRWQTIF
ncbi:hypothetical protein CK203_056873 [Vitis vinifera]|uniref:Retrotransposon gag domain-containing protein n=1 Tax=Vitis vinifera TaxID=29760 RepID=A0A438GW88_VITVI|nr:hypothetical protein CK203_056873 [Vitis vinifera]